MIKNSNKMISLALVKKVISSNLKNFSDEAMNGRPMSDINSSENFSQNNENNSININDINENEYDEEKENNN